MTAPMGGQVLGIDVDAAEQLSRIMTDTALMFNDRSSQLTNQLGQVPWTGNFANQFRDQWNGPARQNLTAIAQMLDDAARQLAQHAQAQRQVSGN
jgi:uncharacterized protein YukE